VAWLPEHHPDALPRWRAELSGPAAVDARKPVAARGPHERDTVRATGPTADDDARVFGGSADGAARSSPFMGPGEPVLLREPND
jgi:hypothetical protein